MRTTTKKITLSKIFLATNLVTCYINTIIINFKQSYLEEFWNTGKHKRVPSHLTGRLSGKLDMLNAAKDLRDLSSPQSNHLHPLHGDRKGQWAISVSGQ